jgi:hypothetical protein
MHAWNRPVRRPADVLAIFVGAALALGAAGCQAPEPEPAPPAEGVSAADQGVLASSGGHGGRRTVSAEYKFPASVDPEVQGDRPTELWARVYRPEPLDGDGRHPLLIFLHGNHATCGHGVDPRIDDNRTYTFTGTCPPGYVVTPNHDGYEYLASELAALGYVIVSINANRGINAAPGVPDDPGLNLARGRLILKHLALLSRWNNDIEPTPPELGASLAGRLDFGNVGLMGHSRGGEGARAAYNQYLDPESPWPGRIADPLAIRGIFEIAPVDGQTSRTLDATGTRWTVLLPMCDGDVVNLSGIRPFDRMMAPTVEQPPRFKASFTVWGANHNYYNTEWQLSDSPGCTGHEPLFSLEPGVIGSAAQRETGRMPIVNFFRASVGKHREPFRRQLFNPLFPLPPSLTRITRVERGFNGSSDPSQALALEDFSNPTGTSRSGLPTVASGIAVEHLRLPEHALTHRGARLSWAAAGAETFFQTSVAAAGSGVSLARFGTLDLRVDRAEDPANPPEGTTFSVQLVNADGSLSAAVSVGRFVKLRGPVGGPGPRLHSMLQTARLPLFEFRGAHLHAIQGVRLTFDRTPAGTVLVADIRAAGFSIFTPAVAAGDDEGDEDPVPDPVVGVEGEPEPVVFPAAASVPPAPRLVAGNTIRGIGPSAAAGVVEGIGPDWIDVDLQSRVPFAERDELLVLQVGATEVRLSRHPQADRDDHLVFTLSPDQATALQEGAEVTVRYAGLVSPIIWSFGPLDGRLLPR